MNLRGPAADRARPSAGPPAGEAEPDADESDVAPPNSLLAHLLTDTGRDPATFLTDWISLSGAIAPPPGAIDADREREPGDPIPLEGAEDDQTGVSVEGGVEPSDAAEEETTGAPAEAEPADAPAEGEVAAAEEEQAEGGEARPVGVAREAGGEATDGAEPVSAAGPTPTDAAGIRSRVSAAVAGIPHPTAPSARAARARWDRERAAIEARGGIRTTFVRTTPAQIAGRPPASRHPPRPDPGPIPAQMAVVREKSGRTLDPATLPALLPSPRGTLPDLAGPILSDRELRTVLLGEQAISRMATDTDPRGLEEQAKLREIRKGIDQATLAAPAPAPVALGPPVAVPGVPVVDEPVAGAALSVQQRAIFAGVVGQLRGQTAAEAGLILQVVRSTHSGYPPEALARAFQRPIGEDLAAGVAEAVAVEANGLAQAIQLAPDQIDAAVEARRLEVERLKAQALQAESGGATEAQQAAAKADARARATARATAEATARAVAKDRALTRPMSVTQARVQSALTALGDPIATELARYDTQLRQRERAVADAIRIQTAAIRFAQVRDQIALAPPEGTEATLEGRLETAAVGRWADEAIAALREGSTSAQATLMETAKAQTDGFETDLRTAATAAFEALRAWGAEHTRATDAWWAALDADLGRWATDADARAKLWETAQGQVSRLALAQDLESVQRAIALQQAGDKAVVGAYMDRLDGEARTVVATLAGSLSGGGPDLVGALTAGIRERVRARLQPGLEKELERRVLALDPEDAGNWEGLDILLKLVQPNWSLSGTADKIHTAVTRWRGHDEESIFEALGALSPIAAKMLPVFYLRAYDQSLDAALRGRGHVGHLNADEMEAANRLLAGERVMGAVGAINSAISGPGAAIDAVNRILLALTDSERTKVLKEYEKRYHETLEAALRDQWSVSRSKADESLAIAGNDLRGANAIALGGAVQTQYVEGERYATIDRDKAAGVFARITSTVKAEGARRGWTTAQIDAEITLRNRELETSVDERFGQEWWAQGRAEGTSAMRTAFALSSGPGRDLLDGMADNDLAKVDVARLRLEDAGLWAEDTAINAVFRDQNARSLEEVTRDLGPVLDARVERQLEIEDPRGEKRVDRKMELERESARDIAAMAAARTGARMDRLGTLYAQSSGRTLAQMVDANMSGTTANEALAHITSRGVLTNYQKLRFSIEGLGTDMPVLRSTLATMSPAEIVAADKKWRAEHDGESLYTAIEEDTSGREQGDLDDMAVHGAPQTAADVVAAARRRYNRDRRGETGVGAALTSRELAAATREVEALESRLAELRRPDLSRDESWRATMSFDIAVERANTAIDLQRAAVDSVTDMLANAAAIVTAVVVGLALSPFTGGGSAVVAAAVISSIAATAVSIGVKALVKGAAYGHEELYTDLAVGAVDALVAALTAGMGNALLGRIPGGVTPVAKSSLFRALARMGGVGRSAAAGQARIAGTLGRMGTQGALVRGLERRAILGGLDQSKYLANRLIARGASQLIEQGVQAVPTSLAASLLDERVYRQPGGPLAVLNNTLEGTVHSTLMGLGMAGAHHVGGQVARVGVLSVRSIADHFRVVALPESRLPAGGRLGGLDTARERLADFRAWRGDNPEGTMREFSTARQAEAIGRGQLTDAQRQITRAAREHLLAELPAHERGLYADVPIRSVSDADFARLTGGGSGDAHLITHGGQAVVLLREGALPSAVRSLLPEVRERVFAGSGGMTVEGALPPRLRDTPIRIDPQLPTDEVRVRLIPPGDGPIARVEVVVGPRAHPIDVALHAGEIDRVRRWTGRVGDARMALARFGERVGLRVESPRDRARFEAAGELRKLGPVIEERIRRYTQASDPRAAAAIQAQAMHLLAQQERARRIVSGELVAEPRGYVAQEGTPAAPARGQGDDAGVGALAPTPAAAAAQTTVTRANELAARIASLEHWVDHHRATVRGAESTIVSAAGDLHRMLLDGGHATRAQLGTVGDFSARCLGSAQEMASAVALLPPGSAADRIHQRAVDARGKVATYNRYIGTLEAGIAPLHSELQGLGVPALRARQNQELDFGRIKGGPGSVCFPPETPVATPEGDIAIATLAPGDEVLAADAATGETRIARVTRRMGGWTDWLVEIVAGGETLRATRSHPLAVGEHTRWLPARLVVPGDRLVSLGGADRIVESVCLVRRDTPTCNLEVADHHSYYAGASGILVHNGDGGEGARVFSSKAIWTAEIYYVKQRIGNEWVVVYVGSTNAEKLTFGRFEGHLRDGRTGDRPEKAEWAKIWDKVGKSGERTIDTAREKSKTRGDIRVEVVVRGEFTDLALAIVEQAHIHANQGRLKNVADAIGSAAFDKYFTQERRAYDHPCR